MSNLPFPSGRRVRGLEEGGLRGVGGGGGEGGQPGRVQGACALNKKRPPFPGPDTAWPSLGCSCPWKGAGR